MRFASPFSSDYITPRDPDSYEQLTAVEQISTRLLEQMDLIQSGKLSREEHYAAKIRLEALKAMLSPTKLLDDDPARDK